MTGSPSLIAITLTPLFAFLGETDLAAWLLLVAYALVPFAVGVSRIRFRRLPLIVGALVCLAYLAFLVGSGIWAATCPRCNSGDQYRETVWVLGAMVCGFFAAFLLVMIALGALVAWLLRRGILRAQASPPGTINEGANQPTGDR